MGTSIGGTIALDFALNHPEDVAALVLIDAQVGFSVLRSDLDATSVASWQGCCTWIAASGLHSVWIVAAL